MCVHSLLGESNLWNVKRDVAMYFRHCQRCFSWCWRALRFSPPLVHGHIMWHNIPTLLSNATLFTWTHYHGAKPFSDDLITSLKMILAAEILDFKNPQRLAQAAALSPLWALLSQGCYCCDDTPAAPYWWETSPMPFGWSIGLLLPKHPLLCLTAATQE